MKSSIKSVLIAGMLVILFTNICQGQERPRIVVDIQTSQKPWNHIDLNNLPSNFQFAIVTDRTGGHRPGVFYDAVKKLNLLQPEFVLSVGDLIEGYTEDTARLNAEWKEFNGFINDLEMPFFYVPGNHDLTNAVMEKMWEEMFGVTYYHFVYNDVLFLCLNSEDNLRGAGRGTIDDEQYEYIKKVLDENQDVKWTLVFLHQPLWVQEDTKRWKDVEKLLEGRNHNVFAGHYHRYWKSLRNNGKYIALATTGGGSSLRGPSYGEFDHVVWVTMTEEGPLLANLLLEGIWDEDVVTEEIVEIVRNNPYPIRIEPVYLENRTESMVSTEVRIRNDSDYPVTASLEGSIHPSIFYKLGKTDLTVDPNSVQTFDLEVVNDKEVDLTKLEPIRIKTEVSYAYEGRPDLVLKNTLNFSPLYEHKISPAAKNTKLDGKLKEWSGPWHEISQENVKGSPFHYSGRDDCFIKFSATYDDDYLYLAFDIADDELFIREDISPFRQDALILGLDARPKHISAMNSGGGRFRDWLLYLRSFKSNDPIYRQDLLPEGIQFVFEESNRGIQAEMAIPVEYLNKMQNKSWSAVRLGIGYYDYDKNGDHRSELFWYPAWDANGNIPGSGMLFREDAQGPTDKSN